MVIDKDHVVDGINSISSISSECVCFLLKVEEREDGGDKGPGLAHLGKRATRGCAVLLYHRIACESGIFCFPTKSLRLQSDFTFTCHLVLNISSSSFIWSLGTMLFSFPRFLFSPLPH